MKPRLLDLFCGAGGAAAGYAAAGFDVLGVDIKQQKHYPYEFMQADVLALHDWFLLQFDAIHASPPCQGYSSMRHAPAGKEHPKLIPEVRRLLRATGKPYVIENVEQAGWDMVDPIRLCGTMFGLWWDQFELQRHRLFESNFLIVPPHRCWHRFPAIGVYGGHVRCRSAAAGGRRSTDFDGENKKKLAALVLGIDWMTLAEMSEAIPPAYTREVGLQLLRHLERRAA
jgi:DNA (cytosine-5)-methyltransferase 1